MLPLVLFIYSSINSGHLQCRSWALVKDSLWGTVWPHASQFSFLASVSSSLRGWTSSNGGRPLWRYPLLMLFTLPCKEGDFSVSLTRLRNMDWQITLPAAIIQCLHPARFPLLPNPSFSCVKAFHRRRLWSIRFLLPQWFPIFEVLLQGRHLPFRKSEGGTSVGCRTK